MTKEPIKIIIMIKPRPRDFIQTKDDLIFAVVSYSHPGDKVPGFLRYVRAAKGFKKVNTRQGNKILTDKYPEYLPLDMRMRNTLQVHQREPNH